MDNKPPLGARPYWMIHEARLKELLDASMRYLDAQVLPPKEWASEIGNIIQCLFFDGRSIQITTKPKDQNNEQ